MFRELFKKQVDTVTLPDDKDFVFCFKKKDIILDEECDFYKHNKECDKNGNLQGRTHLKHTMSGASRQNDNLSLLNECKYCLEDHNNTTYRLSTEALKCMENNKEG